MRLFKSVLVLTLFVLAFSFPFTLTAQEDLDWFSCDMNACYGRCQTKWNSCRSDIKNTRTWENPGICDEERSACEDVCDITACFPVY